MFDIAAPYLLLVGDARHHVTAKTAIGIKDWRPGLVAGQLRFDRNAIDLGVPDLTVAEAAAHKVRTLVIGVSPAGGQLPALWIETIVAALKAGLDVASGLHTRLSQIPSIRDAAAAAGRRIHEVRHPTGDIPVATGRPRTGKRLLTVGTDCGVGKKYTALVIDRELRKRGVPSDFRATGQTGILIAGGGIAIDAVVADFIAGAAEVVSPDNDPAHWDVIEGQGSLFQPRYAGVSLGLLHGSQPDAIVLCHEAGRTHVHGVETYALPDIEACIEMNLALGRRTNPRIRCVGVSINTSALTPDDAAATLSAIGARTGLPCVDPVRGGVAAIVDLLLTPERKAA